ncbi:MAG TPA: geranylgeranylglycerol-phosphate geranylgeranyltransferase [Nitrososphaerales archaeon]|nr:geranylgeranylglycerol-phosphate geranylgeranyltransferase [Nitrososphaerales archaeon]
MTRSKASLRDWVSLTRPANSLMVGFAVVVGIAVASNQVSFVFSLKSLLGFLTGFLISSFSMVTNDIYDLAVDTVNQPSRPLPSGRIRSGEAKAFSIPFLILGLVFAAILGAATFLIASIFAFIGWYYNFRGKSLGLGGNYLVALSLAIPYIYGAVELGNYSLNLAYFLALTSFLAGLGREVLKGIADIEGDKLRKIKTVALSRGARAAKNLSSALFVFAVASSILPILFRLLGSGLYVYVGLVLIPDAIFVYLAFRTLNMKANSESLRLKGIALLGMLFGLLAYLAAGLAI